MAISGLSDGVTNLGPSSDITWTGDNSFDENIVMASGKGIDFSATADGSGTTTSELFDDYEEGTWTPVITDGSNNATSASATGTYTKVGNRVHIGCNIATSSLGSVSGPIQISGLPFTSNSASATQSTISVGFANNINVTLGRVMTATVEINVTVITLNLWDLADGTGNMTDVDWSSDGQAIVGGTYLAA